MTGKNSGGYNYRLAGAISRFCLLKESFGYVARAGRRKFVHVDEQTFGDIAWVIGHHPLINIFLNTLCAITRGYSAARSAGIQTSLEALSLSVDVLHNHSPFSFNI